MHVVFCGLYEFQFFFQIVQLVFFQVFVKIVFSAVEIPQGLLEIVPVLVR
jgi:hypothetical protein